MLEFVETATVRAPHVLESWRGGAVRASGASYAQCGSFASARSCVNARPLPQRLSAR